MFDRSNELGDKGFSNCVCESAQFSCVLIGYHLCFAFVMTKFVSAFHFITFFFLALLYLYVEIKLCTFIQG